MEKEWLLRFPEVQAFKYTTEESAASVLGALPPKGAFYEVADSPWLLELGMGRLEYLSSARHYTRPDRQLERPCHKADGQPPAPKSHSRAANVRPGRSR